MQTGNGTLCLDSSDGKPSEGLGRGLLRLGDYRLSLVGIDTFVPARVHSSRYIIISGSALQGVIRVGYRAYQGTINARISRAAGGAAVHVVARHRGSAGRPV